MIKAVILMKLWRVHKKLIFHFLLAMYYFKILSLLLMSPMALLITDFWSSLKDYEMKKKKNNEMKLKKG